MLLRVMCSLKPKDRLLFLGRCPCQPAYTNIIEGNHIEWIFDADPVVIQQAIGEYDGNGLALIGPDGFEPTRPELVIRFPSIAAASEFKSWLCNRAEQDYWEWMDAGKGRDSRGDPGMKMDFNYHFPGGSEIIATPYPEE